MWHSHLLFVARILIKKKKSDSKLPAYLDPLDTNGFVVMLNQEAESMELCDPSPFTPANEDPRLLPLK